MRTSAPPSTTELGDALFENPASVRAQLEKLVNDWGKDDGDEEDEEGEADAPKKSLPEKKKKKLLSEATWRRDAMLMDVANQLRKTSATASSRTTTSS